MSAFSFRNQSFPRIKSRCSGSFATTWAVVFPAYLCMFRGMSIIPTVLSTSSFAHVNPDPSPAGLNSPPIRFAISSVMMHSEAPESINVMREFVPLRALKRKAGLLLTPLAPRLIPLLRIRTTAVSDSCCSARFSGAVFVCSSAPPDSLPFVYSFPRQDFNDCRCAILHGSGDVSSGPSYQTSICGL